jgi:hypothetical protein
MGEERKVYMVLVGKLEGKRPFVRPRGDSISMDLREIGWRVVEWIKLAQNKDW